MKSIVTGIVAHVDAGKTTLSEALLYQGGTVQQLGRVDNGDAFLDPEALEKKRGITIFTHAARLQYQDLEMTLLDTPGHVDFASQTEQVFSVLDYAILVISATDGIQGYTRTLWQLLAHYHIPTFIFINKLDVAPTTQADMMARLQQNLAAGCVDFTTKTTPEALSAASLETIAVQDDAVLETYLDTGTLAKPTIQAMIQQRQVFPCYFGSALKMQGITEFLMGLAYWTQTPTYPATDFGAKIFKITHDPKGERLTWIRMTGGTLTPKTEVLPTQKINQIRRYNGEKYALQQTTQVGGIYALTGLTTTRPGQGLGGQKAAPTPQMQPVLNYAVNPKKHDIHDCLAVLRQLEDEDPQLHVSWSSQLQELKIQIMGKVQLEILQQILQERFDLDIAFEQGQVLYKETLLKPVEGVGHFEPLRHYSEVHLQLTPLPAGSGLQFATDCSLEVLGRNWQHQVLTSLQAKTHLGVLIGAPITDMRLTLVSGRASNVHSVGGDFRQATWRAVRQGLMMAKAQGQAQLLEPWYQFRLEIDQTQIGRAINDIQQMGGDFEIENTTDQADPAAMACLTGTAPVATMQDYAQAVNAYTHGHGQLTCLVAGYRPCHNAAEVIADRAYQPVSDLENTPDSVFCAHGAGYPVAWDQVPGAAHVPYQTQN